MNPKSIIFLLMLLSLVLFLVGINLGKTIEKVNKTSVIKPTTSTAPLPTITDSLFHTNNVISKLCGIDFLLPDTFKSQSSSSDSGTFVKNKQIIKYTCKKNDLNEFITKKTDMTATAVTINSRKIPIYTIEGNTLFVVTNPLKGNSILFETSDNLTQLILRSLQFSQ